MSIIFLVLALELCRAGVIKRAWERSVSDREHQRRRHKVSDKQDKHVHSMACIIANDMFAYSDTGLTTGDSCAALRSQSRAGLGVRKDHSHRPVWVWRYTQRSATAGQSGIYIYRSHGPVWRYP